MLKIFQPLRINLLMNSIIRTKWRCIHRLSSQPILKHERGNSLFFRRNFTRRVFWFLYPTDKQLKEKDKVSSNYKIIYKGTSVNYVKYCYIVMIGTTVFFISGMIWQLIFEPAVREIIRSAELHYFIILGTFWSGSLFATHDAAKTYVYRIYYSEEDNKYLAILMDKHPFAEKGIELLPGSLVSHRTSKFLKTLVPWRVSLYETPDKQLLNLDYLSFEHAGYYNNLVKTST